MDEIEMLDAIGDEAVQRMAQFTHEHYLEDVAELRDKLKGPRPADTAWDALSDEAQIQNIHQVRHQLMRVVNMGYTVATPDRIPTRATTLEQIPPHFVEFFAREEHTRWADIKRRNGYHRGEKRCDEPPDLRHPDLVAYDDLETSTQELDRRPVERIPSMLEAGGLVAFKPGVSTE